MDNMTDNGEVTVSINEDDADAMLNFSKFFAIPLSDELSKAVEAFKASPSVETQNIFKRELCRWMLTCDHPAMQDELWDVPKEACKKPLAELDFQKELEAVLTSTDNK